jgi:hypothetical protein
MKRTIFLLCRDCNNIFLSTNEVVNEKVLLCGQGCGNKLEHISKSEAYEYFQERQ